jgi:hypothetical protein
MRGISANRHRTADTPNLAAQGQSVSRKTVAEVPLTGLSFLNDLDSAKNRLTRLQAITDYPKSDGAAFWLAERHALQHDQTRILGAVLAERGLTAAETQPDSGLK